MNSNVIRERRCPVLINCFDFPKSTSVIAVILYNSKSINLEISFTDFKEFSGYEEKSHYERTFLSACSTCQNSVWRCTNRPCPSMCKIIGGFVSTFDGAKYTFNGRGCGYFAVLPLANSGLSLKIMIGYVRSPGIKVNDPDYLLLPMFVNVIADNNVAKITGGGRGVGATFEFKAAGSNNFNRIDS